MLSMPTARKMKAKRVKRRDDVIRDNQHAGNGRWDVRPTARCEPHRWPDNPVFCCNHTASIRQCLHVHWIGSRRYMCNNFSVRESERPSKQRLATCTRQTREADTKKALVHNTHLSPLIPTAYKHHVVPPVRPARPCQRNGLGVYSIAMVAQKLSPPSVGAGSTAVKVSRSESLPKGVGACLTRCSLRAGTILWREERG